MRFRFFTVPVRGAEGAAQELNQFLAGHRILAIDRHLVADGGDSAAFATPEPTSGSEGPHLNRPVFTASSLNPAFVKTRRRPACW